MYEDKFSAWHKWENRNSLDNIHYPGIYVIAHTDKVLSGARFSWIKDIIYIGMTNSAAGLKGRLKQFDNTIVGKEGHGGADRVRYKYQHYDELTSNLYVSVIPFIVNVKSIQPDDLRVMGEVAKFEYDCFAHYVDKYGELPEFNNKKKSPKYSLTIGRENKVKGGGGCKD